MISVGRWTGAEAMLLRDALGLTLRAFATKVDVAVSTVAVWASRGRNVTPRLVTQRLLYEALNAASAAEKRAFKALLANAQQTASLDPSGDEGPGAATVAQTACDEQPATDEDLSTRPLLPMLVPPGDAGVHGQTFSGIVPPSSVGETTDRRQALKLLGTSAVGVGAIGVGLATFMQSAVEAMEFTRRAEASQIGPQTLDHLEAVVAGMAAAFAHTPPQEMFQTARWYRHHVQNLLAGQHTLREGRELYRHAGWLSIILAWTTNDLGDPMTAEAHSLDAWEHGWQAEDNEVCAWAMDARATIALYSNHADAAMAAAERGLQQAPAGSAPAVRVSAQLARAYAKLGQASHFQEALDDTRSRLDQLGSQSSGLFSADAGRVASYAASSYIWLGQPDRAIPHAHEAISFYSAASPAERSPTREAISRLDLALAHTALGQPDEAAEQIESALSSERVTGSVLSRFGDVTGSLRKQYPQLAMTKDLVERCRGMAASLNRTVVPNPS